MIHAQLQAAASVIHSYGVVPSHAGVQRWYVYRKSEVDGGKLPESSLTFFDRTKAYNACDELNALAVIEMWRCG